MQHLKPFANLIEATMIGTFASHVKARALRDGEVPHSLAARGVVDLRAYFAGRCLIRVQAPLGARLFKVEYAST